MSSDKQIEIAVSGIFRSYLRTHDHRITPERISILKEIYQLSGHFNVELLHDKMKQNGHTISKATLYNTLQLLINCNLIKKLQFGDNIAQYEKSFKNKQHDHIICMECEKVVEFCDPRVQQIQNSTEKILGFEISHHSLYFYGKCKECYNTN
jgi:Fur family ferric uptake transcriptional regulator